MLRYLRLRRMLRFLRPGRLAPWLGPVVGLAFAAGRMPGSVVLSLPFPMPPVVRAGEEVPLTLTLLDPEATDQAARVWERVRVAEPCGPQGLSFTLGDEERAEGPLSLDPLPWEGQEEVPAVRVMLTGPLFLRCRDARGLRRPVVEPGCVDLLRATLHALAALGSRVGALPPTDLAALREAASRVALLRSNFVPFQQTLAGPDTPARVLRGVVGNGVYGPLPRALAACLAWGGTVHVGFGRHAGAGGWRVEPA